MTPLQIQALTWHNQGIIAIPIHWRRKTPVYRWEHFTANPPDRSRLLSMFDLPLANMALLLQSHPELVVLDFDDVNATSALVCHDTLTIETGRGLHYYFFVSQKPKQTIALENCDVKCTGYVLAPPSIHPSGKFYQVKTARPIQHIDTLDEVLVKPLRELALKPPPPPPTLSNGTGALARHMRTGQSPVEYVRSRWDIKGFVAQYVGGREWRKSGSGEFEVTNCPFHDDQTPSFWAKGELCNCFAPSCMAPKPMDVINLAARYWGCSNSDAIWRLYEC